MKKALLILALVLALPLVAVYFFFPKAILDLGMKLERSRASLTLHRVQVGDHEMVYLDNGANDKPAIVFVHGFGADKEHWTRMAPYVGDAYRVVAPDMPGFGQSSRLNEASYDVSSQVERLHAFASALGLDSFHIAGNSMGGHISAVYATTFTQQVLSVGLFANAGVTTAAISEVGRMRENGINPLLVNNRQEFEGVLDLVFTKRPWLPGPLLDYLAEQSIKNRPFNEKIFNDLMTKRRPLEPILRQIVAPVYILWGDNDRLLDVSAVDVMTPLLPDVRKVTIFKNCGHVPMVERPAEAGLDYREFLDKL